MHLYEALSAPPHAPARSALDDVWVIVPTFNEAENVARLVRALRRSAPAASILVVDDDSPDGTGRIADDLAAEDSAVMVLHRPGRSGIGRAYQAGMACAIAGGATTIVQMDCDFSHDPAVVPELLSGIESGFDLVVGSRYVDGGRVEDWPLSRRLISRVGCTSARLALDLPLRDLTGGFKAWRTDLLRRIAIDTARSSGYSFQIETTWRAESLGARIVEVPIVFRERVAGVSKMNGDIVREAIGLLVRLRRAGRFHEVQAAGSG